MNRLANETSPYLRQHRDNPVDWYPWGDEAFAAARARDVPILLSVGYSACHWCHVMAHESFEDQEVADSMNAKFVSVKVDREERPDVDAVYMDAVQAMTGRGGWPMTVVIDPDGRPMWGGTYFSKENFLKVLDALDDVWRNRREDLHKNAEALVKAIAKSAATEPKDDVPGLELVNQTLAKIAGAFDSEWGGFGSAPKFPSTHHLELALRAFMTSGADDAKRVVTTSLDAMASGGMYDHIGGGFARYSVDREWLVPHFEKMLYDQALAGTHLPAGAIPFSACRSIARSSRRRSATCSASSDTPTAASTPPRTPTHPTSTVTVSRGCTTPGPQRSSGRRWPVPTTRPCSTHCSGSASPSRATSRDARFRTGSNTVAGCNARPPSNRPAEQLLEARSTRRRPGLDDKVLTEWNAMFLYSLADAAITFQRDDWKAAAIANGEFLLRELRAPDGRWSRSWQSDGQPRARHDALAGDHAALIEAFIRLAELTGQARWIEAARHTADTMLDWYWDPQQGGLYTTAEDREALVVRQKDLLDNATPSANSSAAHGLQRLSALTGETRYQNHADRILQLLGTVIEQAPGGTSNALSAIELRHRGLVELAIVGEAPELVRVAQVLWRPDLVLAWGEPYDSPLWQGRSEGLAYMCRDYVCEAPVSTPEALYEKITGRPVPEGLSVGQAP